MHLILRYLIKRSKFGMLLMKQNLHWEKAMEPSEIINVLARAAELQAKIDGAIRRASCAEHTHHSLSQHPRSEFHDDDDDDDSESEAQGHHASSPSSPDLQKLTAIRDALLDLQDQLDSVQALQKRQKFEREDHLVELEERRKLLIKRLREYNGTEWEIVQEAHAFVGEPVQREDDLVLPPYQSSVRDVHALGEGGSVSGLSRRRHSSSRRTSLASRPDHEEEDETKQAQEVSEASQPINNKTTSNSTYFSGFVFGLTRLATRAGEVLSLSAKSALVVASIVFMLSQLEPQLRKWSADKALNAESHEYGNKRRSNRPTSSSNSSSIIIQDEFCPPGKVLLVQDGVQKCFVKERVEAPFEEVIRQPDASYGYG